MGGNNEESLEDKSVTVVYGYNMVDVFFVTFVSNSAKVAKVYTYVYLKNLPDFD